MPDQPLKQNPSYEQLESPELLLDSMEEGFASCKMIYDTTGNPVDFRYLYVNSAFAKLTGLPVKKVLGRTVKDVLPKIEPFWIDTYARVVRTGKSEHFENSVASIGKLLDVKVWRTGKGSFGVVFDDITEKKRLAETAETSKVVLESTGEPIFSEDLNGNIITWNKAAEKLYGYKNQEMVGKSISLLIPDEKKEELNTILNMIKDGKEIKGFATTRKVKNGKLIKVLTTILPLKKEGQIIGAAEVQHNVSDVEKTNKRLEETNKAQEQAQKALLNVMEDLEATQHELKQEKAKDEAMLSSIGDGLIAIDNNRKITVMNKPAERMLGYKKQNLLGKDVTSLLLVDEQGQPLTLKERPTYIALTTGRSYPLSTHYYVRKDKTKFSAAILATPVKLEGKTLGAIDIFRDITREKEIDKAKDEFVSLASHQLRSPLTSISWYSEMLINGDLGSISQKLKKYLQEIYRGSQRMIQLVDSLLDVSRLELGTFTSEPKSINPVEILQLANDEQKRQIADKKLNLNLKIADNIGVINFDPKLLKIIFQNLISNAVKYTSKAKDITIDMSVSSPKQNYYGHSLSKKTLCFSIADTGYGIPLSQQRNIFTKLFRADNAKVLDTEGTGLGLYIVKSIIEHSKGKIWFTSIENQGTTFYVMLPIASAK